MPNLLLIRDLAESKKIAIVRVAEIAGMTPQGLHSAINKGDIKFSYLDKIANLLGVDLSVFSDYTLTNNIDKGETSSVNFNTSEENTIIKDLREKVNLQAQLIHSLQDQVDIYKNLNGNV